MKKVLFTATTDSFILHFQIPYMEFFKKNGYEVHVATAEKGDFAFCDKKIMIPFSRNPYKIDNLIAIRDLKKIIKQEKYEIIHTHTPMGSVVTRLAAMKEQKKGRVRMIYTAHGFHFFKGAPLLNWIIYYPVEKILMRYVDDLITINQEDYNLSKLNFRKPRIHIINGIGVDSQKYNSDFTNKERENIRKNMGFTQKDYLLIFPSRLDRNKNQEMLIKAVNELIKSDKNIHLLLPGVDEYNGYYQEITLKMNLNNNIHFLGYRRDVDSLLKASDLAVSSSYREGQPINLIEALLTGLPIVATDCRGNRDVVKNGINGYLVEPNNVEEFVRAVLKIKNGKKFEKNNVDKYSLRNIMAKMEKIYKLK